MDIHTEKSEERSAGDQLESLVGLYLSFKLSRETYGINILKVVEIISLIEITTVPNSPKFIKGIINLRGQIIPVIDLRLKFGIPEAKPTRETCIIVVTVTSSFGDIQVGLLVDSVREVVDINLKQLGHAPKYGNELDTSFVSAMAQLSDETICVIVDVERALKTEADLLASV